MLHLLKIREGFHSEIDGEITFLGVLIARIDGISYARGWKDSTKKQYANEYSNIVLPVVQNIALSRLSKEDFEYALERIKESSNFRARSEDRMRHLFLLIFYVLEAAEQYYGYPNVLQTSAGNIPHSLTTAGDNKKRLKLPQTLSVEETLNASKLLFGDDSVRGEFVSFAIMLASGVRPAEACGLDFGDLIELNEHKGKYCFVVATTSAGTLNSLQVGGKTRNATRKIPVHPVLAQFILRRKAWVAAQLPENLNIDRIPMVCVRNEFTTRANTNAIDRASDEFFKAIGMENDRIAFIRHELMTNPQEQEETRGATPYLLRRNFATVLKSLGASDAQIKYLMGHDLAGEDETKAYFINEDELIKLWDIVSRMMLEYTEFQPVSTFKTITVKPGDQVEAEIYEECIVQLDESVSHVMIFGEPTALGYGFEIESDTIDLIHDVDFETMGKLITKALAPASTGRRKNFLKKARALKQKSNGEITKEKETYEGEELSLENE